MITIYAWVAHDSSRVLGLGQTQKSAYANAMQRHPDVRGYAARIRVDQFPGGANPLIALTHGLWTGCPPTHVERGAAEEAKPDAQVRELKNAPKAADTKTEKAG